MIDKTTTTPAQATPETGLVFNLQLFADETDSTDTSSDTDTADTNSTDETTDSTDTDTTTTDTTDQTDNPTGAPESYADFTVQEGLTFDKESAGEFHTVAKDLNLSQEQAQKLVDLYGTKMLGQQATQQAQAETWATESKKTFKPAEIDLANKTLGRFADKEFIELLTSTGLGNHPKMVGLFKSIGSQMSEGQFVSGGSALGSGPMFKNSPDMYK